MGSFGLGHERFNLSSTIIQEQLTPLYSGARMPRINESDFMGLKIPLPSPQKQQEIVDYISEVRRKIATLQLQIHKADKNQPSSRTYAFNAYKQILLECCFTNFAFIRQ